MGGEMSSKDEITVGEEDPFYRATPNPTVTRAGRAQAVLPLLRAVLPLKR